MPLRGNCRTGPRNCERPSSRNSNAACRWAPTNFSRQNVELHPRRVATSVEPTDLVDACNEAGVGRAARPLSQVEPAGASKGQQRGRERDDGKGAHQAAAPALLPEARVSSRRLRRRHVRSSREKSIDNLLAARTTFGQCSGAMEFRCRITSTCLTSMPVALANEDRPPKVTSINSRNESGLAIPNNLRGVSYRRKGTRDQTQVSVR